VPEVLSFGQYLKGRLMKLDKILLIGLNGIGDLLMATPLIRTLRENLPESKISIMVAAHRGTDEVIKYNPCIDEVIVYVPEKYRGILGKVRLVREIRKKGFHAAIVLYPSYRTGFSFIIWLSNIPLRIGHITQDSIFKRRWENFYNRPLKIKNSWHHIDFNLELASFLLGKKVSCSRGPEIYLSEEEKEWSRDFLDKHGVRPEDKLCGFHPGSHPEFKLKRWPKDWFIFLSQRLVEDGYKILLFGSKEEEELLRKISDKIVPPAITVQGLNILKVAALVAGCSLFVANDSGLMHMASALNVPLVALIGPSNPAKIGPRGENKTAILTTENDLTCRRFIGYNAACLGLFHNRCLSKSNGIPDCFADVSIERVIKAVKKIEASYETF